MMKHARWGVAAGALVGAMMLDQPAAAEPTWYIINNNQMVGDGASGEVGCTVAKLADNPPSCHDVAQLSGTEHGPGQGEKKDQSGVMGQNGDIFVGFLVGNIAGISAEVEAIRNFVNWAYDIPKEKVNLATNINPGGGEPGKINDDTKSDGSGINELLNFPNSSASLGTLNTCALTAEGCSVEVAGLLPGYFYFVKYGQLGALFSNAKDSKIDFKLGADNFDVSHVTFVTPIPAALPMLGAAIAGLGFAGWRRNRAQA